MANPAEFEQLFRGFAPAAAEEGGALSRALGSNSLSKELPALGKPGPMSPGISTRSFAFRPPQAVPPPMPEYAQALPDMTPGNAALGSLTDEVSSIYQNLNDPAEQDRVQKYMQMLSAVPPPPDPIQWPNYLDSTQEKLAAARDLAGAPHDLMMAVTGEDHSQQFLAPPEAVEMTKIKFGEARWARGVIEAAQQAGVDLNAVMAMLPPAEPAARIAALAQAVQAQAPDASVGPPPSVMPMPAELRRGVRAVQQPESPKSLPLLNPHDITYASARVAPNAMSWANDPEIAAVHTQQINSHLAAAQPFTAGRLYPDLPATDPRLLKVPGEIPITVDNEGRMFAQAEGPNGEHVQIEVTKGLTPAAIPALVGGGAVPWKFEPNRTAPVRYALDRNTERLLIDPAETEKLKPLQAAWKFSAEDADRDGIVDPMSDPVEFLNAISTVALPTSTEAENAVANSDALRDAHVRKGADIIQTAKRLVGPDATPREVARETARIIQEYHAMGCTVEAARAIARMRRDQVALKDGMERVERFGPQPIPAEWLGWQETPSGKRYGLWNLTEQVGTSGPGSTVTTQTLLAAGFEPNEPERDYDPYSAAPTIGTKPLSRPLRTSKGEFVPVRVSGPSGEDVALEAADRRTFDRRSGAGLTEEQQAQGTVERRESKDRRFREGEPPEVDDAARDYMAHVPWHYDTSPWEDRPNQLVVDKCAFVHNLMPNIPFDPQTMTAYDTLKEESWAQYLWAESQGYKMEPFIGEGDPYGSAAALAEDVSANKHLFYPFPTDLIPEHPFSEEVPESPGHTMKRAFHLALQHADTGAEIGPHQMPLTYGHVFAAVHALFGHGAGDESFVVAYSRHSRMFSPEARPAMAAETIMRAASHALNGEPPERKVYVVPEDLLDEIRQTYSKYLPQTDPAPIPVEPLATKAVQELAENGATEFHALNPETPNNKVGYVVGVSRDELRHRTVALEELNPLRVAEFLSTSADVLAHPGVFVSGWVDAEGTVWLEPKETVLDLTLAQDLAMRRGRTTVWDTQAGKEIAVAGLAKRAPEMTSEMVEEQHGAREALSLLGPLETPDMRYVKGLGIDVGAIKFGHDGTVDIGDVEVRTPLDIVRALMPQRNPTFETVRWLFVDVDEGKLVHQIAVTSRLPNTSRAWPSQGKPNSEVSKEMISNIRQTVEDLSERRGGARIKVVLCHNHPTGITKPSPSDNDFMWEVSQALPPGTLAYGLITDHDNYHVLRVRDEERNVQSELKAIPEVAGTSDPLLKIMQPHSAIGQPVFTGHEIERHAISPEEVVTQSAFDNFVSVLYRDNGGKVRMVEHLPAEMMADGPAVAGWVSEQGRRVGAKAVYAYHPYPADLGIDTKELVMSGALADFVQAGGEGTLGKLSDAEQYLRNQILSRRELNASTQRLSERDDEETARLRAEALANSAAGNGWSGRRGRQMFGVLTPEEKFHAMLARISDGQLANERHLEALNPSRWASVSYPKYFGEWRPDVGQIAELGSAWAERRKSWTKADITSSKLDSKVKLRARSKREVEPLMFTLDDLTSIQTSTLDRWAKDEPAKYDEWVRAFYKVVDPITDAVQETPRTQARASTLASLDSLRSALGDIEAGKISEGPHPNGEQNPYNGVQVACMNARGTIRSMSSLLRMMGRPYTVLGNARQGDHPLDIQSDIASGKFQRSLFQDLWQGHMKVQQDMLKAFTDFDLLSQAAQKSEDLDRKIFRAMDTGAWRSPEMLRRPEWQVAPIRVGMVKHTIDLSEELPKLAKFYDNIIGQAEKSISYRLTVEASRYRNDIAWVEQEIRRRELAEALKNTYPEVRWVYGTTWEDIPKPRLEEIQKKLKTDNAVTQDESISMLNSLGVKLGLDPYKQLLSRRASAATQLQQRIDNKDALLNDKAMRRDNYVTYIHRATVDYIRGQLSDPYSTFGRYITPKVRNHYLESRDSDKLPYQSWLAGWFMYVPAMLRTIHLEPGLIKASKRVQSLPVDQQEYAQHWIRHLKGTDVPWDKMMNRVVFEGTMQQPNAVDGALKALGVDLPAATKAAQQAGQLNSRPWSNFTRKLAGWSYFGLIGPVKVGLMNLTEWAFLAHELAKRPVPDMPLGAYWGAKGFLRAGAEGSREFASWIKNVSTAAPRWYSEASYMGVTDSANSIIQDAKEKEGLPAPHKKIGEMWGSFMKAGEYWLRASTYYTLKSRGKWYGLDNDLNMATAAQQTNHLIGAYSKRDLSPVARGGFWNPWWIFKRFNWAKGELFAQDVRGATEAAGHGIKKSLGWQDEQPPSMDGGSIEPPMPPKNTGGQWDDWPDEERDAFLDVNAPAGEYGAAFPAGTRGSMRLLMQLAFGAPAALGGLYAISSFLGLFDDTDSPWDRMNPTDMSNLAEITALFWVKDTFRFAMLNAKRYLYGVTAKEDKERDYRAQRLLYFIPMIGRAMRQGQFRAVENQAFQEGYLKRLGISPFTLPKTLRGRIQRHKHAGPITRPGLIMSLMNHLPGRPSLPATPEPTLPEEAPQPSIPPPPQ